MESKFSASSATFAKEAFQIAEWALVVSALVVAGRKLDIPIAMWSGYFFFALLCFHLGVRVNTLMGFARPGAIERGFSLVRMTIVTGVSAIFGLGLSTLVNALIKAAG